MWPSQKVRPALKAFPQERQPTIGFDDQLRLPSQRTKLLTPSVCHLPVFKLRPRSRAVQRFASTGFRVRLFSSLRLVVAPPACEPGQDTSANSFPRLNHLAPGQLPILSGRSPGATGLASSLSGCFSFTVRRCRF
jgi:hypothetical protein